MTKSAENLTLDRPWAIGEEEYKKILNALSSRRTEIIV